MIVKIIAINILLKSKNNKDYETIQELFYAIVPELCSKKIIKQIKNAGGSRTDELKRLTRTKHLHIWIYKHEIEIMRALIHELFKNTYALLLKTRKNIEIILHSHRGLKHQ